MTVFESMIFYRCNQLSYERVPSHIIKNFYAEQNDSTEIVRLGTREKTHKTLLCDSTETLHLGTRETLKTPAI